MRWLAITMIAGCGTLAACSGDDSGTDAPPSTSTVASATSVDPGPGPGPGDSPYARLLSATVASRVLANGSDMIEVWICSVPADTTYPWYQGLGFRLALTPVEAAASLQGHVSDYFDELSGGRYAPQFIAGGNVAMSSTDTPNDCVDRALDASAPSTRAVFAIADAEHRAEVSGGWGRPGSPCASTGCPASKTRRAAYIGASDFHPDWGSVPAIDLSEHEVGHMIGWSHSGSAEGDGHDSGLDVMSNSAAPRDVDPSRRHAPNTLAINRIIAGWMPAEAVRNVSPDGATVELTPSNDNANNGEDADAADATRVAIVPVDDDRFLTVELLTADGYNDTLDASGIAIHLVDPTGGGCTEERDEPCVGSHLNVAQNGEPPFTTLLLPGDVWTGFGRRVTVESVSDSAAVIAVDPWTE